MTEVEQEYFQICAWRYLHPLPETVYGEVHHILPKSCGGFDKKFNLVRLTAQEHYRCHELLPIIFKAIGTDKEYRNMLFGWHILNGRLLGKTVDAELFAILREEYAKEKSASLKGHRIFKKKDKKKKRKKIKHSPEFLEKQKAKKAVKRKAQAKKYLERKEREAVEARCVYCGCMDHHD